MYANGEVDLIRRLAPARFTTVFDVGAHVGDWSLAALAEWGGARVHAFEVAPPTFDRLRRHVHAAGLDGRVDFVAKGLGEATDRRDMYYFPEHPHLTCDMPRHHLPATPFVGEFVSGDAYMQERQIGDVDFVKVDVEGAEHLVFRGFRRAIEEGRVHCMQFEYGAFSIQTRVLLADYYDLLAPRYWIGKLFPATVEFRDYDWTMENFRFSNFICVSRNRPDLKQLAELRGTARAV
jgi:FkbM family methyltransferase